MNKRYRLCSVCGRRWNISVLGPNPRRYVCPVCEAKRKAAPSAATLTAARPRYVRPYFNRSF